MAFDARVCVVLQRACREQALVPSDAPTGTVTKTSVVNVMVDEFFCDIGSGRSVALESSL